VASVEPIRINRMPRRVTRVRLTDERSVIVKYIEHEDKTPPGDYNEPYERACLGNEAFALTVLGQFCPGSAPELIGADGAIGAVALADLGDRPSMATHLLQADRATATETLCAWARTLGRVHGSTAGRAAEMSEVAARIELPTRSTGFLGDIRRCWQTVTDNLAAFGISAPDGCAAEVETVAAALADPAWKTLIHGDPCPDNAAVDPLVLFDWETAHVGHALLDAAYLWMPMPTCWCAGDVPRDVRAAAESAYRDTASAGLPLVCDDGSYESAAADTAVAWWLQTTGWGLRRSVGRDAAWGISTHRHRLVHRARVLTSWGDPLARRYPALVELAGTIEQVATRRWPEAALGLAPYPAFA